MNTPNLFILGAQKAGTSYLAKVLSDHPGVFFSTPKEPMFFSHRRQLTRADFDRYCHEYFAAAGAEPWRGEGSTTYLQWPGTAGRLAGLVPGEPRFIVCLRQPLAKAVSFFIHNWRRDRHAPGTRISDTLDLPVQLSPFLTSLYADAIEAWFEHYPRERFLFLKFDDLERDPALFVRRATEFLDIAPAEDVPRTLINAGFPLRWENDILTIEHPDAADPPRFSLDELSRLQGRFLPDLRRTADLTGLDLSDWEDLPQLAARETVSLR